MKFVFSKIRVFAFAQNDFKNRALCTLPWRDVDDSIGICRFLLFSEKGYFHETRTDGGKSMKLYKTPHYDITVNSAKFLEDSVIFDGDMTSSIFDVTS